jgi:metal-responsive CopG/Arc/MetJ family transcriptional regulator
MPKTPMISGSRKLIGVNCPVPLWKRLEDERLRNYTTRSSIILKALEKYLREVESKREPQELR